MGNNTSGSLLSGLQLRRIAAATGAPLQRILEIYGAYRYYSRPFFGLSKRNYIRMYRTYNPQYSAFAPEIADRTFFAFDRNRNDHLNFYEFLTSVLLTTGETKGAMQLANLYIPQAQPGMLNYNQVAQNTNFLYRFYGQPTGLPYSYLYAQNIWNKLSPQSYSGYIPANTYFNYIQQSSPFSAYFQQPYTMWPKTQLSSNISYLNPLNVKEEVYPLIQTHAAQPIVEQASLSSNQPKLISDEVYPMVLNPYLMTNPCSIQAQNMRSMPQPPPFRHIPVQVDC